MGGGKEAIKEGWEGRYEGEEKGSHEVREKGSYEGGGDKRSDEGGKIWREEYTIKGKQQHDFAWYS